MIEEQYRYMPFKSDGRTKPHSDVRDGEKEERERYSEKLERLSSTLTTEELLLRLAREASDLSQAAIRLCIETRAPACVLFEKMENVTMYWDALNRCHDT